MAAYKAKCHICTGVTKADEQPMYCSDCGADLVNPGAEIFMMRTVSQFAPPAESRLKTTTWDGPLIMTNQRIFFLKESMTGANAGGGLLGAVISSAVSAAARGQKIGLEIRPGGVVSVEAVKYNVLTPGILINTIEGGAHKLYVPKKVRDEWIGAIMQYFARRMQ